MEGVSINNLDVYPNPSDDIFNISFISQEIQSLKIRVLNIVGEVIYSESIENFVGEYTKQIDVGDNAKGVYLLEINNNTTIENKKIIIR